MSRNSKLRSYTRGDNTWFTVNSVYKTYAMSNYRKKIDPLLSKILSPEDYTNVRVSSHKAMGNPLCISGHNVFSIIAMTLTYYPNAYSEFLEFKKYYELKSFAKYGDVEKRTFDHALHISSSNILPCATENMKQNYYQFMGDYQSRHGVLLV